MQKVARKTKSIIHKAETEDGRAVRNLRLFENGWVGLIDNVKVIWDFHGHTGKGFQWTLRNIRPI